MAGSTIISERRGFLAALFYRNYRYLWFSNLGIATAASMEMVVIGWLVLELTNSPFLVGAVAACRFVGMGFGPFFGALADRFDRRRILMIVQVVNGIGTLSLAALYYASLLEIWHIFVLVLIIGFGRALDATARLALIPDTVDSPYLTSAVGLMVASMGLTVVIGSLAAGLLFDILGAGGLFGIMTGAYFFDFLVLLPMRLVTEGKSLRTESVWESVIGGIQYTLSDRAISALMLLAAIANLFAFPSTIGIMPVFARNVLHVGSDGLGWLIAAEGMGGLIGALVISGMGKFKYKGWLLIMMMVIWPALLGVFASLSSFYVSLAILAVSGVPRGMSMSFISLLLLIWSLAEVRGRVIGVRMFAIIFLVVGNILSGLGATLWGADTMMKLNALASVLTVIITAFWVPQLRQRQ